MKKILSSVLAAATLASLMIFPATAEVQSVTQEVEVLYMNTKPTFDGVIDAAEWGADATFTVSGKDASKPGDTAPSAQNTFAYYSFEYDDLNKVIVSEDTVNKDKALKMGYKVWLRWDKDYLYIAAEVSDPDGYYLPAGREKIWDGDCLQFRVDPMGPNSYRSYKDPDYDYKVGGFDTSSEATSGLSYYPWAYSTKICNIGLGTIKGKAQAYDMADQGTGNMTKQQLLNDPNKMGPGKNPLKDENNYASEFAMKTCDENANGITTYEVAVPWVFIDQWGLGQVAVGYAWGMSMVVLNGYDDGDSSTSPYQSYLTWGSGICGAQQDQAFLRATCGGSNAIILSDKDIAGNTVEGLPVAQEKDPTVPTEVEHRVIDATGMDAYYLPGAYPAVDGDYTQSMDIVYLGNDPINPDRTWVGTILGDAFGMAAGWDAETKTFFIGGHKFNNGLDRDIPRSESDVFEWQIGDWHNMTIEVIDSTVTIYLDGEEVLSDTDKRYVCTSTSTVYEIITYNIGDFMYDNYKLIAHDEVLADYTCDTDDAEFLKSDFQLRALPMGHSFVKGECKNANPDSKYNCLIREGVNAEGKRVMKCDFCGLEEEIAVNYCDADDNGKININDVTLVLKQIAKWDNLVINIANADADGNGKININDVTLILKVIAKWDVVPGPKA